MKIYVASSWRNPYQQEVVQQLKSVGHEVYDFRNPKPGDNGFHWSEINPDWRDWTVQEFTEALSHPLADTGFGQDMNALIEADTVVLVKPCGISSHLELGYAAGKGKTTFVLMLGKEEPELMYKMCDGICGNIKELMLRLNTNQK